MTINLKIFNIKIFKITKKSIEAINENAYEQMDYLITRDYQFG